MNIPLHHVDAFTDRAFRGNPAAVCLLPGPAKPEWMQAVALEMNLSETAFLHQDADAWQLRWFTPKVEVKLCGHATLASAHVLWESAFVAQKQPVRFNTLSGVLTAVRRGEGIVMDFPARPLEACEAPPGLARALGVVPLFVGRSAYDYLVEVAKPIEVRALQPDFALLSSLPVRGVIVTSPSDTPEFDFVSRFFAPAAGVNEDPVTGSAHCTLGPFWQTKLRKSDFTAYQASARGGVVTVSVRGDRVLLGGKAVTVLRGTLAPAAQPSA